MSEKSQISVLSFRARYLLHTYSAPLRISLKQVSELFINDMKERFNQDCLVIHRNNFEKIFVFRFGTVVFFNMSLEDHAHYLSTLGMTANTKIPDKNEDELAEDNFTLTIEPGVTEVSFNSVKIPEIDIAKLQLVAHVLAQSSALELIEWEVEEFLAESENMAKALRSRGFVSRKRHALLRFIGEGLSTRHRIINQLALFSEPEKTWEKEDLYRLFVDLFKNFDIKDRIEKIEKMLSLSANVSELLLGIISARRTELMELVIIVLIAVELLKSLL